jgi:hypothetical protein
MILETAVLCERSYSLWQDCCRTSVKDFLYHSTLPLALTPKRPDSPVERPPTPTAVSDPIAFLGHHRGGLGLYYIFLVRPGTAMLKLRTRQHQNGSPKNAARNSPPVTLAWIGEPSWRSTAIFSSCLPKLISARSTPTFRRDT